jgi:hypothetical protein
MVVVVGAVQLASGLVVVGAVPHLAAYFTKRA